MVDRSIPVTHTVDPHGWCVNPSAPTGDFHILPPPVSRFMAERKEEVEAPFVWHALSLAQVLDRLRSSPAGLSEDEAARRLSWYGPNRLPERPPPSIVFIFFSQFRNPLIYILLIAAAITAVIDDLTDTLFILLIVLINSTITTIQQMKAEQSAEALKSLVTVTARVLRGNRAVDISANDLVLGDVVLLESGWRIPADIRLLEARDLLVDESPMTGESVAVEKGVGDALLSDTPVADRWTMAHAGSTAASGRAVGMVVATAGYTQMGRIASSLAGVEAAKPPLLVRMEIFTRRIAVGVIIAGVILGLIALYRGMPPAEVFFSIVALAVSAIPEGIPVALTVVLSIAAARMAKRNVIVRRIAAVESLGSCTCIASDKTGTLTVNEQTLALVWLPDGTYHSVTGSGYTGEGTVEGPPGRPDLAAERALLARIGTVGVLANEAELERDDGGWRYHGDSVDIGFLAFAYKLGLDPATVRGSVRMVHRIPYESERRYAAVVVLEEGRRLLLKGALETLLPRCTTMATPDGPRDIDRDRVEMAAASLSAEGYRVLAVAEGEDPGVWWEVLPPLSLLGLVGFIDPVRPDAARAVAECQAAGIRVIMVTGDHPATALAIASTLGIASRAEVVVTGTELETIGSPELPAFVETVARAKVFARVAPLQKLEIVEALLRLGHFVAVTGDGVNDAPALRRANIGVAMGSGTDIAKDTASMIVTDDRFGSIVAGVEEGRFAYDNVRKVTYMLVSMGAAEVLLFLLAVLAALPIPLVAIQLLYLNLITNGIQQFGIAFEPGEPEAMRRPPRPPDQGLFDRLMLEENLIAAVWVGGVGFAAWAWMLGEGIPEAEARGVLLILFVLFENVHIFNCRSETVSAFRIPFSRNWFLILSVFAAWAVNFVLMHIPLMAGLLEFGPISPATWGVLIAVSLSLLVVMEAYKRFRHPVQGMR
jgi:magnesium-transporting ATPase (P-type)